MITYALLAIIVVFSIVCFNDRKKMEKYLFHPYSIYHNKEHYRFLSHAFIHGDTMHLLFNCLALYSFGLHLEQSLLPTLYSETFYDDPDTKLGEILYLVLYTGGIYAASLTEYFRNKNNPAYSSLGASGAISAVVFCSIILDPQTRIGFFFIPMPGWLGGLLLLGLSYVLLRKKRAGTHQDNVSHEAHFWGAIYGIIFVLVLKPSAFKHFVTQIFGSF